MPKWGFSKGDYFFDNSKNVIAKGLSSVKYLGTAVAEELYQLSHKRQYRRFVDVLQEINSNSSLNTRQLDILTKIDFFSEFGNQRELLRITELFYDTFNRGQAKKILKSKIEGTPLVPVVDKHSVGFNRNGAESKSYTILNMRAILEDCEDLIKAANLPDITDIVKVQNFADAMGYVGYISGNESDRRKLYILDIFPLLRKRDSKQFGYSIVTKSIGSGKESRFTVFDSLYRTCPVYKGDIIYCKSFERDGQYFTLTSYTKI